MTYFSRGRNASYAEIDIMSLVFQPRESFLSTSVLDSSLANEYEYEETSQSFYL